MRRMAILVLVSLFLFPLIVSAQEKYLVWDANTETDLAGYRVYHHSIGDPNNTIMLDVGNVIEYRWGDLVGQEGNIFWVTAYDTSGNESDPSNKIDDESPGPPSGCRWEIR